MHFRLDALLLAAGFGTRLGQLTRTTPKCLIEVKNITMLEHWINIADSLGCKTTFINTHYLHEMVAAKVENIKAKTRLSIYHEKNLLGTAGTLVALKEQFGNKTTLVAHVDNFLEFDLGYFVEAHKNRPQNCIASALTFSSNDKSNVGIFHVDNLNIATEFFEKDPAAKGDIANAAIYLFEPEVFKLAEELKITTPDISKHLVKLMLGKLFTIKARGPVVDIGTPKNLALANLK